MAVTEDGIIIERFPTVLGNIEESQRELIDPNIINRDDQILSDINVILAEQIAKANEFIEAVRDSWDIARAEGLSLDNLLFLKKVFRIPASKSFTNNQIFVGANGTNIPAGRRVRSSTTQKEYILTSGVSLNLTNCIRADLSVGTVADSTLYAITVAGTTYSYTSDSDATAAEIYTGIQTAFTANPLTGIDMTSSTDGIVIDADGVFVNIARSSNIAIDAVYSRGRVEALETGVQIEPSNTLTQMTLPVTGLVSTYNPDALVLGRLRETDEEFRLRGIQTISSGGTGTVPVIESSLLNNVQGVTAAFVIENATAFTVGDLPPHSYKVVVSGGEDLDVASDIWRTKPSGIETVGDEEITFPDNRQVLRTVKFQRPTPIILAIRVTYSVYDEEEFPISGNIAIRQEVVSYINSLGIGKDVIPNRLFAPIYTNISGIDELVVEIQVITESGDTPVELDWQDTRLPIENDEYATVAMADVYVFEDV